MAPSIHLLPLLQLWQQPGCRSGSSASQLAAAGARQYALSAPRRRYEGGRVRRPPRFIHTTLLHAKHHTWFTPRRILRRRLTHAHACIHMCTHFRACAACYTCAPLRLAPTRTPSAAPLYCEQSYSTANKAVRAHASPHIPSTPGRLTPTHLDRCTALLCVHTCRTVVTTRQLLGCYARHMLLCAAGGGNPPPSAHRCLLFPAVLYSTALFQINQLPPSLLRPTSCKPSSWHRQWLQWCFSRSR